jgi:hypothetical protein
MSLSPGTRLGHYNVSALIGEGGMGRLSLIRSRGRFNYAA